MGTCPACGGRGVMYDTEGNYQKCASCAGTGQFGPAKEQVITWDDRQKQFTLKMAFAPRRDRGWNEKIADLPAMIARESRCSCGGHLTLGDHSVRTNHEGTVIDADYYCVACHMPGGSTLEKIRSALGGLWGQVTKLKISAAGLEIEKAIGESRTEHDSHD